MCTGYAAGSGWLGISSLFFIPTQRSRIHFFPLKIWKCQIMFSLHVFDLTFFRTFVVFFSSPPLPVLPLTPACLSFPSGRFLMSAGRLWRALPQMQNILPKFIFQSLPTICSCANIFLSANIFIVLPWKIIPSLVPSFSQIHKYSRLGGTHIDHQVQFLSGARTRIPPCQHCSAPTWMDWTLFWSFPHLYFDFPPMLWFLADTFGLPSHQPPLTCPFFQAFHQLKKPVFFSTVLSLLDLLLFKLYTVMFYTIIDNKIAPEPFSTVLVLFFFFLEHNLKMTNTSWFVSEKWNSSPLEGGSSFTASSLAKERFPEL